MSDEHKNSETQNEGEGNRTAAREYNEKTRRFVAEDDVEARAREAKEALAGEQKQDLHEAEQQGRSKAREEDPQVRR